MRILVTNDDGIMAPGIRALWEALEDVGEVFVAAPDTERSACSQSITVHDPIRVDELDAAALGVRGWRIGGTPTDCVKMALEALLPQPPELLVSGINLGPNMGTDVLYSGTVSAAIEGAMHDIPSLAVSLNSWKAADFSYAASFAAKMALSVARRALPPRTLLNINVPAAPAARIAGVAVTRLGRRGYRNTFDRRVDPRGRVYYWMAGEAVDEPDEASDATAVSQNKVSITPIHFDLTNYAIMDLVKGWGIEK